MVAGSGRMLDNLYESFNLVSGLYEYIKTDELNLLVASTSVDVLERMCVLRNKLSSQEFRLGLVVDVLDFA